MGNFAMWPGILVNAVQKQFPKSEETTKGHSRKIKVGIQTTKVKVNEHGIPVGNMVSNSTKAKRKEIFMRLVNIEEELYKKIFSYQTGAFPYKLSKGTRYVMVLLEYNSENIMTESMEDCMAGKMIRAYQIMIN